MAQDYNISIKRFNGTDYDTLFPMGLADSNLKIDTETLLYPFQQYSEYNTGYSTCYFLDVTFVVTDARNFYICLFKNANGYYTSITNDFVNWEQPVLISDNSTEYLHLCSQVDYVWCYGNHAKLKYSNDGVTWTDKMLPVASDVVRCIAAGGNGQKYNERTQFVVAWELPNARKEYAILNSPSAPLLTKTFSTSAMPESIVSTWYSQDNTNRVYALVTAGGSTMALDASGDITNFTVRQLQDETVIKFSNWCVTPEEQHPLYVVYMTTRNVYLGYSDDGRNIYPITKIASYNSDMRSVDWKLLYYYGMFMLYPDNGLGYPSTGTTYTGFIIKTAQGRVQEVLSNQTIAIGESNPRQYRVFENNCYIFKKQQIRIEQCTPGALGQIDTKKTYVNSDGEDITAKLGEALKSWIQNNIHTLSSLFIQNLTKEKIFELGVWDYQQNNLIETGTYTGSDTDSMSIGLNYQHRLFIVQAIGISGSKRGQRQTWIGVHDLSQYGQSFMYVAGANNWSGDTTTKYNVEFTLSETSTGYAWNLQPLSQDTTNYFLNASGVSYRWIAI